MSSFLSRKAFAAVVCGVLACTALPVCAADRKVQHRVEPVYPELAKRMRIGGTVRVEVTIATDGTVTGAKAISGNKMLAPAAEEAIKKWKFTPGDGTSIENIDINFEVTD